MQKSIFNIVFEDYRNYLIYNTLFKESCVIEKELYNNLNLLTNAELDTLKSKGFITAAAPNEHSILRYIIEKERFNTEHLAFIYMPTLKCNLNCHYCYQKDYSRNCEEIDIKYIENWLKYMCEDNTKNVLLSFYGGEPLLKQEEIINLTNNLSIYYKSKGIEFKTNICTNGYLLNLELINTVYSKSILEQIQITVHDINEFKNKYHEKVLQNVNALLSSNINTKINLRFDVDKLHHDAIIEFLNCIKLNQKFSVTISPILPWDNDSLQQRDKFNIYSQEETSEILEFKSRLESKGFIINRRIDFSCKIMLCPNVYVIDPEGYIYKCDAMAGQKRYSIGSIFDFNKARLNRKKILLEDLDLMDDECKNCGLLPVCMGGCKYRTYFSSFRYKLCNKETIKKEIFEIIKHSNTNIQIVR